MKTPTPVREMSSSFEYEPGDYYEERAALDVVTSSTDADELAGMAQHPNPVVRVALAANEATPREVLRALGSDIDPFVREAVVGNPNADEEALLAVASEGESWVLGRLLDRRDISAAVLAAMAQSGGWEWYRRILRHRNCDGGVLRLMVEGSDWVQDWELYEDIAGHRAASGELLDEVVKLCDYDAMVTKAALGNTNLWPSTVEEVVLEADTALRRQIAQMTGLTEKTYEKLAAVRDLETRNFLAKNPDTPERVLEALLTDHVTVRQTVVKRIRNDKGVSARLRMAMRLYTKYKGRPEELESALDAVCGRREGPQRPWQFEVLR